MLPTCLSNVKPLSIVIPRLFTLVRVQTVVSASDKDGIRSPYLNLAPVPRKIAVQQLNLATAIRDDDDKSSRNFDLIFGISK